MKRKTFFLFAGPSVIIMVLLMILPLFAATWLGFHYITFRNITEPEFVGLRNYTDVLRDPQFWDAMRFTILYVAVTVPSRIVIGFVVALLLDQVVRFRGIYIAGMLLPYVVTPVVGTLIYRQAFDKAGLFTYLIKTIFDYKLFFNPPTVRMLILLHGIWVATPFTMIVLFAGLQTLPKEPLEAALVDGATWLQRLWYVVIPYLRSLFVFTALIGIMDAYRVFDSVFVLSQLNPNYDASIMTYNFRVALSYGRLGKANAMSILTVVGIFVVLIPFLYMTYREQVEER
ncbi:MAG: sugar ABC transporter permease [Anaerolineales bacterium]|nr:sugar ABC transporter permease [Anaerolineales bacterium]